ncbi:NADH dehydrogenase [ubiquinone] 1 alpha subcomplex subunit 4 [Tupaia chinensis]|uniref:Cytochrome c oxidase subunit NDUFA4 n=2 Tax=Tupaia chinensis TaxID=246437 RepID=L9JHB6_TUPCH|nr:NADH dehydrogenase [ubiquinone] 1 alpha subcomplex subunit 4 [Tupaia chinensis]
MRSRIKAGTVKDSHFRAVLPQGALRARGPSDLFSAFGPESSTVNMLRQILGQAKKHPSLIPLFIFIGAGGTGAALYLMRLAVFNPDVSWDRKNNPEPWNKLGPNDQYKFYSVNVDYSKLKKEGPDF